MTDLHTIYTYDTLNRLTSITSSLSESLGDILYPLYDKLGNRKEEINSLIPDHNFHFTYNYNERYELENVQDEALQTPFNYQYDATGNRLQATENGNLTTYTPNTLNQYSSVNGQSYSYDAKGNLTSDGNCTYSYDYENRLISAACGVQPAATYQYDPFGRRITKHDSLSTTLFIHDQDHILESYNCDLTLQTCTQTHSFLYSNRIDEPLLLTHYAIPGIGKDYFYHTDALGNIVALTDQENNVTEYVQYDPYGQPHFFNSDSEPIEESTVKNPFLFTGRFYDYETGNYDYRYRTDSPKLGRFYQRDPLGFLTGPNLYWYVENNPINWVDPYGLRLEKDIKKLLDEHIGNRMSEGEKWTIAEFTGKHIGILDVPGLAVGKPEAVKKLEDKVREALKGADPKLQDLFNRAEQMKKEFEQQRKENEICEK